MLLVGIAVGALATLAAGRWSPVSAKGSGAPSAASDPNAACAGCHRAIYEEYRNTPMARASGPAAGGFLAGGFTHAASGVSYRMAEEGGRVLLKFWREEAGGSAASSSGSSLNGQRELRYFIGSGTRGRTYLFEQDGYWFETPINWYGKKRIWDMAPNYLNASEMPLTLPVDPPCLRCHSSEAQPSLPEARNKYAGPPFLEGGIACAACHGDASEHLSSGGKTPMTQIGALPAVQRDSICLSCHLEGQEAVVHAGKRLVDFRPGESIFAYASFYVRQAAAGSGTDARATSQWEALLASGCKRGAGEKLTCTSCHDPHGSTSGMEAKERVAFYRAKCLACHDSGAAGLPPSAASAKPAGQPGFAAGHHPENPDCASCHMPRVRADDIAHEQVTDHSIPRAPSPTRPKAASGGLPGALAAIGAAPGVAGPSTDRDLGLAYAFAASRGDQQAGERAIELLSRAEERPDSAKDGALHEQLGFLYQLAGKNDAAAREYALALEADPHDSIAAGDLALLKAGQRQYAEAAALWDRAFQEDPAQLKAGMNLAIVECGLGRKEAALGTLGRMLAYSPDDREAGAMALEVRSGARRCGNP